MSTPREAPTRPAWRLIAALACAVVLAHVVVAWLTPYEFHRDEFLYMAMGRHLSLFAMDFPPFIAIVAEVERALLGDSIVALRLAPALAHGALVALAGWIAWALGGGRFAQLLAMTPTATAPLFLRAASLFQPVVFDQLWWSALLASLVALQRAGDDPRALRRAWLGVGFAAGLGLLTKFAIAFLGIGVLAGLLVAGRRWLATRWPWLAVALGLVIGAPSIVGQIALGLPVVGQMGDLQASQLERIEYADWWLELVLMHGPAAFLLALLGVLALLASARFRVVGVSAIVAFAIIALMRGKAYYVGPLFPLWFAAGAVTLDALLARAQRRALAHAARATAVVLIAAWGIGLLPLSMPIASPQRTAALAAALGITAATTTNQGVVLELPQDYADMLGWESKVARVARVWHALPPQDRARAVLVAENYGQAGALDFYGPRHGLPPARLHKSSYWYWGPGELPGEVVVKIGDEREDLDDHCRDLTLADVIDDPWLVPEERNVPIWICRDPVRTLQEIWPQFEGTN